MQKDIQTIIIFVCLFAFTFNQKAFVKKISAEELWLNIIIHLASITALKLNTALFQLLYQKANFNCTTTAFFSSVFKLLNEIPNNLTESFIRSWYKSSFTVSKINPLSEIK